MSLPEYPGYNCILQIKTFVIAVTYILGRAVLSQHGQVAEDLEKH